MTDTIDPSDHPSQIGPYRILDTLGEGGMAVVYLAEQTEPMKRRVALKILKLGMDTKQIVARFESERQALAVMNHPNIEKVFDAGALETGRPYFVMELVHGIPISDYCDTHKLTTAERLRLIVDVCSAVQHAHHKGVIHRDIKPSNILVGVNGGKPQVKVIDFGIAKAVGSRLTDKTLVTRIGQFVGTPQYMSPEQAEMTGLDVDSRTDIYSLGVVLYELLVGALPIELGAVPDQAVPYALRMQEPSKPSTRLTDLGDTQDEVAEARHTDITTLRRELKGDLDWVVMKAMAKDRTRRYETVNALAMDCMRYLRHEPVLARPPSTRYVIGRFVRRNRIAVVAGAIALLAVLIGATLATVGMVRAVNAERVASQEAETARQVSDFLVELFEVSDPGEARGNTITAREILDSGASRIESELVSQPGVQATLMQTMGRVYHKLGLYKEADALLEQAVQSRVSRQDDMAAIAESLQARADLLVDSGDYEEAERLLDDAMEIVDVEGGSRERLASVLNSRAILYRDLARYSDAEASLSRAISVLQVSDTTAQAQVADSLNRLAVVYRRMGRYDDAEPLFHEALEIRQRVFGTDHPAVATTLNSLAILHIRRKEFAQAEALQLRALAIREKTLGELHPDFAKSLNNIGGFYAVQQRLQEAKPYLERALAVREVTLGPDHPSLGENMHNLAVLNLDLENYAEAESWERRAISNKERALEADHPDLALSLHNYANILTRLERYDEAETLFKRVLAMQERTLGADHPARLETINSYADLLNETGREAEAAALPGKQ